MDVLVGGEYAGGMPVSITDSGGCADNPDMVELSADVAVSPAERHGAKLEHFGSGPASDAVRVGVPTVRAATQSELRVRRTGDGHGNLRRVGLRVRLR